MSDRKAERYVSVGGKTFFFNVSTSRGGYHYLTVVARRKSGDETVDEKMTLFPNQIGSFIHVLMETYADMCREMGIANYLYLPAEEVREEMPKAEPVASQSEEDEEEPKKGYDHCPQCGADGTVAFLPDVNLKDNGSLVNVVCVDGCGYKWPEDQREWAPRAEAERAWNWNWLYRTHKKHNG